MKITIFAPEPPFTRGHQIRISETNKSVKNSHSGMFRSDFDEDEISYIIGEKNFDKFENSGKYEFDIPAWKIKVIEDNFVPKTREQMVFSLYWNQWK